MRERETTFQYAFKHTYASTTLSRDGCRLPLRPSPIFFFSLDRFFSRRGGGRGEGKREAIPGDGLDGKTKHPGGCLRAAPVIRLAGGEAWSLAPVGVGSPGAGHRKSAGVATPYRESRTRSVYTWLGVSVKSGRESRGSK